MHPVGFFSNCHRKVLFEPFSSNFLSSAFGVKVKSQSTVLSSVLLNLCFFIMKYS